MTSYLKFNFDLGYGTGLPVIIVVSDNLKSELLEYFETDFYTGKIQTASV